MNNRKFQKSDIIKINDFIQNHLDSNDLLYLSTRQIDRILTKENFFETEKIKPFKLNQYLKNNPEEEGNLLAGIKRRHLRLFNKWHICNINNNTIQRRSTNDKLRFFISQRIDKANNWFFQLYFWCVILFTGLIGSSLGLIPTLNRSHSFDYNSIGNALVGYAMVLLTTSAIELIMFSPKKNEPEHQFLDVKSSIRMIGIASLILALTFTIVVYILNIDKLKTVFGILFMILSVLLWFIANAVLISPKAPEKEPKTTNDTTGGDENDNFPNQQNEIPQGYKI